MGERERERDGDHPVVTNLTTQTRPTYLIFISSVTTPTLLLLLLQLSPVCDDINILDVLLLVDGHRYIFSDIESQRPDTVGK